MLCIMLSLKSSSGGGDKLATSGVPTRGLLLRAFSIRSQNCFIRLGPDQFLREGHYGICNRVKFQLPNFIILGERAPPRSPKMVHFCRFSKIRVFEPPRTGKPAWSTQNNPPRCPKRFPGHARRCVKIVKIIFWAPFFLGGGAFLNFLDIF